MDSGCENFCMHIELHHEIPDRQHLRAAWNALVHDMERTEVFYTWEWAKAVETAYEESVRPWLLLLENEDKSLAGIAALATDKSGREFNFLTASTGDYSDFLSQPGLREAMTEAVLAECAKLNARITLANLPADSATVTALRRSAGNYGYHLHVRPAYECAQVFLTSAEQRQATKADLRRKKMRRLISAVEGQLAPRLKHLVSWPEIKNQLPAFERAHIARFEATGRKSNLADPRRRVFLEELARLLSEAGWLRLSRLQVGETAGAWNYGFRFAGSWFWYQPTFDTQLEQFSPGLYLLAKMIEGACDDPDVSRVDLGLGAEAYKERFANGSRRTLHVTLTRSYAKHVRGITRYRTAQLLKNWPAGEKAVRGILKRLAPAAV